MSPLSCTKVPNIFEFISRFLKSLFLWSVHIGVPPVLITETLAKVVLSGSVYPPLLPFLFRVLQAVVIYIFLD